MSRMSVNWKIALKTDENFSSWRVKWQILNLVFQFFSWRFEFEKRHRIFEDNPDEILLVIYQCSLFEKQQPQGRAPCIWTVSARGCRRVFNRCLASFVMAASPMEYGGPRRCLRGERIFYVPVYRYQFPPPPPLLSSFLNSDIIDLKISLSSMAVRAALACSVTGGQILGLVFSLFGTSCLKKGMLLTNCWSSLVVYNICDCGDVVSCVSGSWTGCLILHVIFVLSSHVRPNPKSFDRFISPNF